MNSFLLAALLFQVQTEASVRRDSTGGKQVSVQVKVGGEDERRREPKRIPVTEEHLLSAEGYAQDPAATTSLVRSIGGVHGCVVLATQGDIIPSLVSRIADEDDVDLAEPPLARKASVWALELQGDRLVSAEYFPPPDEPECGPAATQP